MNLTITIHVDDMGRAANMVAKINDAAREAGAELLEFVTEPMTKADAASLAARVKEAFGGDDLAQHPQVYDTSSAAGRAERAREIIKSLNQCREGHAVAGTAPSTTASTPAAPSKEYLSLKERAMVADVLCHLVREQRPIRSLDLVRESLSSQLVKLSLPVCFE